MAKRFIDTDLFKKQAFKELKAPYKLLWLYLICECNHAGIWNAEMEVASLRIGQRLPADCTTVLASMIQVIDGGSRWWVKDFVRFQYGPQLVTANRMHASVIRELERWGLMDHLEDVEVVGQGTSVNAVRHRLSKKMKAEILMRDELTCQYCQTQKPIAELVVDHVHPVIRGGDNAEDNLVACCVRCNGHKTDLPLDEFFNRSHPFINPTERVNKKLKAPFKPLLGAKDMDTDKDKEKDQEKERATTTNAPEIHDIVYPSDFPQSMRTPEAIAAWNDWEKARKEKGKPITATARRLQLADCEAWGTSRAIAALKHSAKSNYQGLFEPNSHSNGTHAATLKTADPSRSIPDKLT